MSHAHPFGRAVSGSAAASIGHHASTLLIGAILATIAVGLNPLPGVFGLTLPLALFAFVIAAFVLMRKHDRRLCEACAASMPLNPAQRAQKVRRRFWMAHTGSEKRFLIPYMVVLIGSNFATTTTVGRVLWAIIQLSMVYLILSAKTHRTLQPWCPWCSGDGGGQHVDSPEPVVPHDDRLPA